MHPNCELLFMKYAKQYFQPNTKVLEIGPDKFPTTYQSLIADTSITWHTLDLYNDDRLTYCVAGEYRYPINDNSYDIVISAQVIEHVKKIWVWINELSRICNKGGCVITINPVSWPYHGGGGLDCWRIFPEGMKVLYEEAGLETIFSIWESLEVPNFSRHIPGSSLQKHRRPYRIIATILGKFGWPVERAYDTITIGKKA